MNTQTKIFFKWLPIAVVITLLSCMVYGVAQQLIRLSANNPQVALAQDVALGLSHGASSPDSLVGGSKVEISQSLSMYVLVYGNDGTLMFSSATLDGNTPTLPQGVIESAKQKGENRITWQPKKGVRQALVALSYSGQNSGVVVVGRSLSESERLIGKIGFDVCVGWIVTLIVSYIAFYGVDIYVRRYVYLNENGK
ncbi:MAG: hypothetical protein WCK48_02775 [bacterium]